MSFRHLLASSRAFLHRQLLVFSHSIMSVSLWPHGLQHARLSCPSPAPRACSNSYPLIPSNHFVFCHPLLLLPSIFPSIRVFSNDSALHIRWPKYWSFSFSTSPSSEYSGLFSFRIHWFDLLKIVLSIKTIFPLYMFVLLFLILFQ